MKRMIRILLILAAIGLALPAQIIKIGSIAPDRSPWNDALKEMGREFETITKGGVKLKIYPGGIAGGEEDMIRKIRVGTLGGAVLTNVGLKKIYQDAYVLNIPFLFSNEEELNYVLEKMKPTFEKKIEEKGFKVIIWSMSGWINFFSKHPIIWPDDLKKFKLSFTSGEPEMEQAWKKMGFPVIPNELKDLMMALQSGMCDAFYLPPLVAGSGQYFPLAPHMSSLNVAPLVGGIIIANKIWNNIPAEYHQPMMDAAERISRRLQGKVKELEKDALKTMQENGLVIHDAPAEALNKWREVSVKGMDELVDKVFSRDVYNQVLQHLKEFRQKK